MRGKRKQYLGQKNEPRITPAGAGKTSSRRRRKQHHGDHPRRCGENVFRCCCLSYPQGSPPQVRGKLLDAVIFRCFERITPAGAGKTLPIMSSVLLIKDHPRRCGENRYVPERRQRGIGSPPQVRGKPIAVMISGSAPRITPAGAGKTHVPCRTQR